jgi:hypothetical protein
MNIGGTLSQTLEFSQQLDILHKHISKHELPVKKSDSFDKQCILLEEYIGETDFLNYYKIMKTANYLSGLIAAPVTIAVIIIVIYAKLNKDFNVGLFILNNPIIYVAAGILLVLVLLISMYFYLIKRKLYGRIYPSIKRKLNIEDK